MWYLIGFVLAHRLPLTSLQDPSVLLLSSLTENFRSRSYSPAPGLAFAVSLMTIRVPQCELSAADWHCSLSCHQFWFRFRTELRNTILLENPKTTYDALVLGSQAVTSIFIPGLVISMAPL